MEMDYSSCNFLYPEIINASDPYNPLPARIKRRYRMINFFIKSKLFPPKILLSPPENDTLNLEPGEWAEVRSIDEISMTLDKNGKYKGLFFMPEMEAFCGKKYKVFKKAQVIKLESKGEVRKLRSPSIFLEGVYCTGEGRNEGCDRACFHFWREAWLKRVPEK